MAIIFHSFKRLRNIGLIEAGQKYYDYSQRIVAEFDLAKSVLIHVMPEYVFSPYEKISSTYAIYLKRDIISRKARVFLDFLGERIDQQ